MTRLPEAVLKQKDIAHHLRDLVSASKSENYFCLPFRIPDFMVEKFAINFGFDAVYGNIFEVKNGKFTGNIARSRLFKGQDIAEF